AISSKGIAIVRIGPNDIKDGNGTVLIDDRAAARDVTEHLIKLGHRRIGFVRGKEDQGSTHERFKGYKDALYAAGIDLNRTLVLPGLFDFETGLAAGNAFLEMGTPPTAVFAGNDDMAAGVLVAAHRHGVNVPADFSIVGFDDSEIAEKMWPALTTIRQPLQALGARAMELLIQIAGRTDVLADGMVETLAYEMVIRKSTGPNPNENATKQAVQVV
ncbi:MAG: substrate-binding domain-containing protein, partial [Pseudomonadota bacterium]